MAARKFATEYDESDQYSYDDERTAPPAPPISVSNTAPTRSVSQQVTSRASTNQTPTQATKRTPSSISIASTAKPGGGASSTAEEDELLLRRFDEIIELLLAAGYFRARIPGLSPFDKVIGGLTWCIVNSQVDLDVDLFFQEEANIGFQIKLGEKIERALVRMKCPYALQSFQIRGLDYVSIFPVVQWLVTKVIETREETGDLLRVISESVFSKQKFQLPVDVEFDERKNDAVYYVKGVAYRYRPTRQFRRRGAHENDEELCVQSTLLEYGHKAYTTSTSDRPTNEKSGFSAVLERQLSGATGGGGADSKSSTSQRDEEERRFNRMMNSMEEGGAVDGVSGKRLRGLVSMDGQVDAIRQMNAELDETRAQSQGEGGGKSGKQYEEESHERQVESLKRQILAVRDKLRSFVEPHGKLSAELRELEERFSEKVEINQRIEAELAKFESMVNEDNKDDIATLRSLLILNESLKKQEEQFRENCLQQLAKLKAKIEQLKTEEPDAELVNRTTIIRETYEKDLARITKIRQALNKKIRDIAMVERKMDEIPSRSELQQYQSQFLELYEQVAAKLTETRKYFQMYNALDDTLTFLTKEISILNSINDNFKNAMKSAALKSTFLEQLQTIANSVDGYMKRTEDKLSQQRESLRQVNDQYYQQIERERAYHSATKAFADECEKNRLLLERTNGN